MCSHREDRKLPLSWRQSSPEPDRRPQILDGVPDGRDDRHEPEGAEESTVIVDERNGAGVPAPRSSDDQVIKRRLIRVQLVPGGRTDGFRNGVRFPHATATLICCETMHPILVRALGGAGSGPYVRVRR